MQRGLSSRRSHHLDSSPCPRSDAPQRANRADTHVEEVVLAQRIEFNAKWEEVRHEPMLRELGQRIRDVRQGPDGYVYLLTEENDAALIRIEPAESGSTR